MGVDETHQFPANLSHQHHAHHVHGLGRGHPEAAAELRGDAEPFQHGVDLGSTAVDDHWFQPDASQEHDVLGEGAFEVVVDHGVAAVLDDNGLARELADPRQGLD